MMKVTRDMILMNAKQTIDIESSIGILKFRKFFDNDKQLLFKYKDNNPEEYCKYFIINQLKNPKLSLDELNELDNTEISNIVQEYLTKSSLINYFDFSNDFYSDFKEGVMNFIESGVGTTNKIINELAMPNAMKIFMNDTFPLLTSQDVIEDFGKNLMLYVSPQQKMWEDWVDQNKKIREIHERTQKYWDDALEKYNMSKKDAFDNLKNYHWIISPNMDSQVVYDVVEIFKSDSQHKRREINHLFNSYLFDNDCERLYELLEIWDSKPRFNNRIKIIRDCIDTINKMPNTFNFSNVIVPTLIAQTEGVRFSFMEEHFLKVDKKYRLWINENTKLTHSDGSNILLDEYWENLINGDDFLEAMNNLFLDILFQKAYRGQPYSKSIHFSRHKILHGENTRYGRKDYVCRCFLILDFLSELSH